MSLVRFGVSIEKDLLEDLDGFVVKNNFPNRSQAIRYLIAENSAKEKFSQNEVVAGVITFVFDTEKKNISQILTELQREYLSLILSSMKFHIDHNYCMEVVAVKGFAYLINDLYNKIEIVKGVQNIEISVAK